MAYDAVPRKRVKPGINRLAVAWPPLPPQCDAAAQAILARLEAGVPADFHPVFGEVFSLKVGAAPGIRD